MINSNCSKSETRKAKPVLGYFGFIHTEVCYIAEEITWAPCIEVNTAVDHHCHLLVNKPYNCILRLFLNSHILYNCREITP